MKRYEKPEIEVRQMIVETALNAISDGGTAADTDPEPISAGDAGAKEEGSVWDYIDEE
jgi:hypothetical protein